MSLTDPKSSVRPHPNGSVANPFPSNAVVAPTPQAPTRSVSDEAIAKLAYQKFMARDCAHGHHEEDWASAKRDLLIGMSGD